LDQQQTRSPTRGKSKATTLGAAMTVIYLLLLLASAVCFALAAFAPGKVDKRVGLVPLGLLLFVLVFVIQQLQAL